MLSPTIDQVVARVVTVLRAFGVEDIELGLSELTGRTGMAKPTVHRLAGQMVDAGLLERAGSRYRLGVLLFELGQRVPRQRLLRDAALPFMEDLYVATRETVHLAVADGTEVLYLEKVAGHRPVASPSRIAGRMPMYCTATGKAILANSGRDLFAAVVDAGLKKRTTFTVVSAELLARQLATVRSEGLAYEREETRLGYASVAAPLFAGGRVVGALSVTAASSRSDPDRLAPGVRTAALGLSRALSRVRLPAVAD